MSWNISLLIRKLCESPYRDDLVYNLDTTYDWGGDCDDEWEQEEDGDVSHIQYSEGEEDGLDGCETDDSSDSCTEVDKHSLSR
jgi:hypothetical protein